MRNTEGHSLKVLMQMGSPVPWPGKRKCAICATIGYGRRQKLKGGKQSKKMAFAANAKQIRVFTAEAKERGIRLGRYIAAGPVKRLRP